MKQFAERTTVSVAETIAEIEKTIKKHGGAQFVFGVTEHQLLIGFSKDERQARFQVPQYPQDTQKSKASARALLLVIKANLEAVVSGIQIFEDAFMANIVMPDGKVLAQHVRQKIASAYETGEMPPMLPDYSGDGS